MLEKIDRPGYFGRKPLLIGESNPYGADPRYALYPYPENSAGWRLCHLIMNLSMRDYIRSYDRVNLCAEDWNLLEARSRANDLIYQREHPSTFVLFGKKVSSAFWLDFKPFTIRRHADRPESRFVILPHPSGLNRMWNPETGNIELARRILQEAEVLS